MDSPVNKAVIYLAGNRGCSQSDWFRSFYTFNFGFYQNENRKPFGDLLVFNDETLKGKATLSYQIEENVAVLLVPVVGNLEYRTTSGLTSSLSVGQTHLFFLEKEDSLDIINPFENDLINFLQIRFSMEGKSGNLNTTKTDFDLDENPNSLIPLLSGNQWLNCLIGKFDGRTETTYLVKANRTVFLFALEGAFEAQNRLMEPRDGLGLWNIQEVEFEALSNGAIMILIEV